MENTTSTVTATSAPANANGHANAASGSLDLFHQSWQSYRQVLDHDLMEHRSLSEALAQELQACVERFGALHPDQPLDLIDLGCGDLAHLPPIYLGLPLQRFIGLDAAPPVVPLAEEALGSAPFPCSWICDDLSRWARDPASGQVAIVVTCFAVHHLDDDAKDRLLLALLDRLRPGGVLLLADMFRHDGDSHEEHMRRNLGRIRGWTSQLGQAASDAIHTHVASSDLPADLLEFQTRAWKQGWQSRLLWTDSHRLEALLRLERA